MFTRTYSTQTSSSSTTTSPTTYLRTSFLSNTNGDHAGQEKLISYARGWAWQQTILNQRLELRRQENYNEEDDDPDIVLMLEHEPVYTLGRGADENHLTFLSNKIDDKNNVNDDDDDGYIQMVRERLSRSSRGIGSARLSVDRQIMTTATATAMNHGGNNGSQEPQGQPKAIDMVNALSDIAVPVIAPNGCPIYRIERGGEVTWHGPGQLVVYPLLDLKRSTSPHYQQDLHWYLRQIEEVVIRTLHHYGIEGTRDEENTGVWVDTPNYDELSLESSGSKKIAAVGVSSSRWITTHGFAINVCPNLDYFDTSMILPCGIEGKGVTSIAQVLKEQRRQQKDDDDDNVNMPTIDEVAKVTCQSLEEVFGIQLHHDTHNRLV